MPSRFKIVIHFNTTISWNILISLLTFIDLNNCYLMSKIIRVIRFSEYIDYHIDLHIYPQVFLF